MNRPRRCRVLAAILFGCAALAAPAAFGQQCAFEQDFEETTTRDRLEAVIDIVNGLVADPDLRLALAGEGGGQDQAIPVFAVDRRESNRMAAHVRLGCRAILVGMREFETAFQKFAEGNVLLEGREKEMLVLLLLHELGHIHLGHYGGFFPSGRAPALNLSPTASKDREKAADAFATGILRDELAAMETGTADPRGLMTITFVASLSFVISSQATIGCLGCRPSGSPTIFWDHSQSHENLEYRLLKMNNEIAHNALSQQLLDDYEAARAASSRGGLRIFNPGTGFRLLEPGTEAYDGLTRDLEMLQESED